MARGHRARSTSAALIVPLLLATELLTFAPASAEGIPTLRMFAAQSRLTLERDQSGFVYLDPGVWITPVGGDFELRVARTDYDNPITLTQVDSVTGAPLRSLPAEMLDSWFGLGNFARVEVRDGRGHRVLKQDVTFCPNSWYLQRLSDEAPLVSHYPYFCGGSYFTRGMVWGIDDGWAAGVVDPYYGGGYSWQAERNRYLVTVTIDPAWVEALGIAAEDAVAEVRVRAVPGGRGGVEPPGPLADDAASPSPSVPTISEPPPESLPDLIALPGWGMGLYRQHGRELLTFNATEWNQGPGSFLIEGFRGPDEPVMAAFQYFVVDGEPVGRAPVGELEFHAGGGHNHWHFEQFTQYTLLDAGGHQVVRSGKQSWCLANTDAIDLSAPGANWQGYGQQLSTSCGGPGALWIREVLDVGWGDTYSQNVSGQAFDVTGVPNGTYYVRVHVNPTGSIFEATSANNIEDRLIRIMGRPGHRRVVVPPWHGIDTEGCSFYC